MSWRLSSKRGRAPVPTPNPELMTEGRFGTLLREGNRELAHGLDQPAAFQRLNERLSNSRSVLAPRRLYWLTPATLLLFGAVALFPQVVRRVRSTSPPPIIAENLPRHSVPAVTSVVARAEAETPPADAAQPAKPRSASSGKRTPHAALTSPAAAAPASEASLAVPSSAVSAPERQAPQAPAAELSGNAAATPGSAPELSAAPDCLSLARRGQTRVAETCFLKRAEGTGLGAEMALYEVARLRRDVLGDAAGALRALAEYRTRFPSGSLRREADMSQLELLVQLGRSDEALAQSEELLSSSAAGERAAELHLLRGHILRKRRSFAGAAREYELAERAGARRGDASYFQALCLEALGRGAEAAALFARYLEQPQHAYAEDARVRLDRLKP